MRASLAHALVDINNTDILLLDEPTNHCEFAFVAILQCLFSNSSTMKTLLLIT